MILTRFWLCGSIVVRWLTLAQHHALPHLGRTAWRLKVAAIVVPGVCAGWVLLPPLWGPPNASVERPLVMERPWTELGAQTPTGPAQDVPEPGTLVVLLAGIGWLMVVRRWM